LALYLLLGRQVGHLDGVLDYLLIAREKLLRECHIYKVFPDEAEKMPDEKQ